MSYTREVKLGGMFLALIVTACDDSLVGTPCVPATEESSPTFTGYDPQEVIIDTSSDNFHVCLVNHFRGLTTCPFGQNQAGDGLPLADGGSAPFPAGVGPCVDSHGVPVVGAVAPQCTDRLAKNAVVWSCLCANSMGKQDDGRHFCSCPSNMTCSQLIAPDGTAFDGPGMDAYCIPTGTDYQAFGSCLESCDPTMTTCNGATP